MACFQTPDKLQKAGRLLFAVCLGWMDGIPLLELDDFAFTTFVGLWHEFMVLMYVPSQLEQNEMGLFIPN